jgi:hypothetical protein
MALFTLFANALGRLRTNSEQLGTMFFAFTKTVLVISEFFMLLPVWIMSIISVLETTVKLWTLDFFDILIEGFSTLTGGMFDSWADAMDGIIDWINSLPLPIEEVAHVTRTAMSMAGIDTDRGEIIDERNIALNNLATIENFMNLLNMDEEHARLLWEQITATEENTESLKELNETLENISGGRRYRGAVYNAQDATSLANKGPSLSSPSSSYFGMMMPDRS